MAIKDKDMVYDASRRRYGLSRDYVKNELGMELQSMLYDEFDVNGTTLPDRTIKYTSNMIYDYMERECANYKFACWLIENDREWHDKFKDCLGYQLMSFAMEGDKAFSQDGTMEKSICARSMQILYKLLKVQRPRPLCRDVKWDIQDSWADMGGGCF